jgi:multiple antibiotic resistance protein
VITGFVLLFSFALLGNEILRLFNISFSSFKIAGGLLLLVLSLRMLIYGSWMETGASPATLGAVPLGFPLLAGPGAITATMVNLQSAGILLTTLSIIVVSLVTWVVLRFMDRIHRVLGEAGSTVVSRVLAVLIAAIAVEFIIDGLLFYLR